MTEEKKVIQNSHNIDNKNFKYYLGLDLGISSVGWAVMAEEIKTKKHYLHDFGVRIFDVAEDGKTGRTEAEKRRGFRSQRRVIRRRAYRIKKIKYLLEANGFLSWQEFNEIFKKYKVNNKIIIKNDNFSTESGYWNPFVLRYKGLKKKLERAELYFVLIHFAKKRGYEDKSLMQEQEDSNGEEKKDTKRKKKETPFQQALNYGSSWEGKTVAEIILTDPEFRIKTNKEKNEFLIYAKNGKYQHQTEEEKENDQNETSLNYRVLFARETYKKELEKILQKQQAYYPELNLDVGQKEKKKLGKLIIETIFQQRGFEDGPKCKGHSPDNCHKASCSKYKTFLELLGNCPYYPQEKRGYKSSLIFSVYYFVTEISKFLVFLKKIGIVLTANHHQELVDYFLKGNFDKKAVKKYLSSINIWKERGHKEYFAVPGWKEMQLDKNYFHKEIQHSSVIKALIPKIKNDHLSKQVTKIKNSLINDLGTILTKNITRSKRESKIKNFLQLNKLKPLEKWDQAEINAIKNMKSSITSPAGVSNKHMLEAIEKFLKGELYGAKKREIKYQSRLKNPGKKIFSKILDWDLNKNPVVFRAINQSRKVLKALYDQYDNFENITIETGKEVAKSWKDRNEIKRSYDKNAKKNEKTLTELKALGIEQNFTNLLKKKLWDEQEKNCIYCGKKLESLEINLQNWEVDHIVPISKYADNSYNNKVLVHKMCNQEKGNKLPLEFIVDKKERKEFITRVAKIKKKNWKKYSYLTMKNIDDNKELEDFVSRNMNDNRYISKWFLSYAKDQINLFQKTKKKSKKPTSVLAITGEITSYLRKSYLRNSAWGLPAKVRDITYFHHAVDAAVAAQFKGQYEVELAVDLVKLYQEQRKLEREKNSYKKEKKEKEINNFFNFIKRKWDRRRKDDFVKMLEKIFPDYLTAKPIYIENFKEEIEKRIPVVLKTIDCTSCKNQEEKKIMYCTVCKNAKKVPDYVNLLNEEEWKKINHFKTKTDIKKINLHYPLVSHMVNYKVKGSWSSSENFGFKDKFKTKCYAIWRKDPDLLEEKNKNIIANYEKKKENSKILDSNKETSVKNKIISEKEKKEKRKKKNFKKWKEWKKDFENNEGFIFNERNGNIIPTDSYYGFDLSKEKKKQWIKIIDFSDKKKLDINQKKLIVKGVNIEYFDNKEKKKIIKNYRSKAGEQIKIHSNQLTFISSHSKNKDIFQKSNYYESTNIITDYGCEIKKINILGKIEK